MSNTHNPAAHLAFNPAHLLVKTLFGFLLLVGLDLCISDDRHYRLAVISLTLGLCFSAFLPGSWLRSAAGYLFDTLFCALGVVALYWTIRYGLRVSEPAWMVLPALLGASWVLMMREFELGAWTVSAAAPFSFTGASEERAELDIAEDRQRQNLRGWSVESKGAEWHAEDEDPARDESIFREHSPSYLEDDDGISHEADDLTRSTSAIDEPVINPATGLLMVGGFDTAGNPYGFSDFDHHASPDSLGSSGIRHDD